MKLCHINDLKDPKQIHKLREISLAIKIDSFEKELEFEEVMRKSEEAAVA